MKILLLLLFIFSVSFSQNIYSTSKQNGDIVVVKTEYFNVDTLRGVFSVENSNGGLLFITKSGNAFYVKENVLLWKVVKGSGQ